VGIRMKNLGYKDLLKAHAIFEIVNKGDKTYWEFYGRPVWSLNNLTVDLVRNNTLKFLNKWRSRIPYSCSKNLYSKLDHCKPDFDALVNEDLAVVNIEISSDKIRKVFDSLEPAIGSTGTSKVMHMIRPRLFVMWDRDIRNEFGYKWGIGRDYIDFMRKMYQWAKDLTDSFRKAQRNVSDDHEARERIEEMCSGKTLAKLLDEYNYIHVHYKGVKALIKCPYCDRNIEMLPR